MRKQHELQKTFFDEELRLKALKKYNSPLLKLEKPINWDIFRNILEKTFNGEEKNNRGRAHYDYVMMFKVLILQTLYQLSGDQMEYQINLTILAFFRSAHESKLSIFRLF